FFCQAEDGIRDFHVTGVQTCALPISAPNCAVPDALREATASLDTLDVLVRSAGTAQLGAVADSDAAVWRHNLEVNLVAVAELTRSEERRVGKECRARGAADPAEEEAW